MMDTLVKRSYDEADEVRRPPKTLVEVVDLGTTKTARLTMEPGWRWSECVKPIAGTETCQARHVGVAVSGQMEIEHGTDRMLLGPGDVYVIEPGHDAHVVGDEPYVGYEFESKSAETYAAED